MKIAIFGATGNIGSRVVAEAQHRGHDVTAIARNPARVSPEITALQGDILNVESVTRAVKGQDVVVSAVGPSDSSAPAMLADAARSLLAGLKRGDVRRLIVVGGAGSLEVKPGLQLVDTPEFPPEWRPVALAHRDALNVYRWVKDLDWTYISPAAFIGPGQRTGHYRVGFDQLLVDSIGESRISFEDYAVAVLDEIEKPGHIRKRITVAY